MDVCIFFFQMRSMNGGFFIQTHTFDRSHAAHWTVCVCVCVVQVEMG